MKKDIDKLGELKVKINEENFIINSDNMKGNCVDEKCEINVEFHDGFMEEEIILGLTFLGQVKTTFNLDDQELVFWKQHKIEKMKIEETF